ncbi:MAG: hypothetical protein R3E13_00730 [Alphaproteobacteria bacterium]
MAIIAGLIGLTALVVGAITLFAFAAEQGFIGLAAYFACWVFLLPVMLVASILVGLVALFIMAKERF